MTQMSLEHTIRDRLKASSLHLLVSGVFVALTAALVFGLWYPGPFRSLSGGQQLFLLAVLLDIVLGPLLTFVVFDVRKKRSRLVIDMIVVAIAQCAGIFYGLHVAFVARPVAMVFEVDRFRVLTTDQIDLGSLSKAIPSYRSLPTNGPWLLGTRHWADRREQNDALFKAVAGMDIGQRPEFWTEYLPSDALVRARPLTLLWQRHPEMQGRIQRVLHRNGLDLQRANYVPVVAHTDWIAVLNANGMPIDFLAMNGFE